MKNSHKKVDRLGRLSKGEAVSLFYPFGHSFFDSVFSFDFNLR